MLKKAISLAFFFLFHFVSPSFAQTRVECNEIENFSERHHCIRNVMRVARGDEIIPWEGIEEEVNADEAVGAALDAALNGGEQVQVSRWSTRTSRSQLDDSTTVTLIVESDWDISGPYGDAGRAQLILRCMENTTSAYFKFNEYFMSDIQGYGRIEYRVDSNTASRVNMDVSTDNMALGLWSGGGSIPFIRRLMEGSSVFVRVTPYNESTIGMTFTIAGLTEEIAPLREACGW